jgi:hypothetical protein
MSCAPAAVDGAAYCWGYGGFGQPRAEKLAPGEADPMLDHCLGLVAPAAPKAPAAPGPAAAPSTAAAPDDAKATPQWKKRRASCHGADGGGKAAKARTLKLAPGTLDLLTSYSEKLAEARRTKAR